jgi:hypothetical protein
MSAAMMNGNAGNVLEKVITMGDLAELKPVERTQYYVKVCESLGLNPLTSPFAYIRLNGKLTLYAKRDTTDQLRKLQSVSVVIVSREKADDIYVVTARATTPDGRCDESTGAVALGGLKGEALANALMKAETKAKRRVTLSICGLGWLDETEVGDVRGAQPVNVTADGEVIEHDMTKQLSASVERNWEEWVATHTKAMAIAADAGALLEAWRDCNDSIKRLGVPAQYVERVKAIKDARKAELAQ